MRLPSAQASDVAGLFILMNSFLSLNKNVAV